MHGQQWNGRKKPGRITYRSRRRIGLLLAGSVVLLVFGVSGLAGYIRDRNAAYRVKEELRELYTAAGTQETPAPGETAAPEPAAPEPETPEPAAPETGPAAAGEAHAPADSPEPAETPIPRLGGTAYPDNPGLVIDSRFRSLREQNADIVGWLTIGRMVDEPVVQRDNTYYMDHDAGRRPNANGAVFLDAAVSLAVRPYALVLYGHNMKSGAMFAGLRNYEDSAFYHNYPFIDCDTIYEKGRYVVFAEGIVSTEESDANYLDFFGLVSRNIHERVRAIDVLKSVSIYTCTLDIRPDDQLLVLVTCTGRDEERRIVAARRVRDREGEAGLAETVKQSRRKP